MSKHASPIQWQCWLSLRTQLPFQAVGDEALLCECEVQPEKPDNQGQTVKALLQEFIAQAANDS